jgi:hypothetical protein
MTISAKHIPTGLREANPVLVVGDSNRAIEFYKTVFGAKERMRLTAPGGRAVHGELTIGHSVIMVSDEFPERGDIGPSRGGPLAGANHASCGRRRRSGRTSRRSWGELTDSDSRSVLRRQSR